MSSIEERKSKESTEKSNSIAKEILAEIVKLNVEKIQKVQIVSKVGKFFKVRLARITTTQTSFDTSTAPNKEWENPLDQDVVIEKISVIPNANFRVNGRLAILNDEVIVFEDDAVGDWTDIGSLTIPLEDKGKLLKRGKSLKFYIWNGTDSTEIALTVTTTFSDKVDDI